MCKVRSEKRIDLLKDTTLGVSNPPPCALGPIKAAEWYSVLCSQVYNEVYNGFITLGNLSTWIGFWIFTSTSSKLHLCEII